MDDLGGKPPIFGNTHLFFLGENQKKLSSLVGFQFSIFDLFGFKDGFLENSSFQTYSPTIVIKTSDCNQHLLTCEAPEKDNSIRKLSLFDLLGLGSFFTFKNVDSTKILTLNSQTIFKVSKTVNKLKPNMIFIPPPIWTSQKTCE